MSCIERCVLISGVSFKRGSTVLCDVSYESTHQRVFTADCPSSLLQLPGKQLHEAPVLLQPLHHRLLHPAAEGPHVEPQHRPTEPAGQLQGHGAAPRPGEEAGGEQAEQEELRGRAGNEISVRDSTLASTYM